MSIRTLKYGKKIGIILAGVLALPQTEYPGQAPDRPVEVTANLRGDVHLIVLTSRLDKHQCR